LIKETTGDVDGARIHDWPITSQTLFVSNRN